MQNKSWIVTMRKTIISSMVVEGCSKEQAKTKPYDYDISDEQELAQVDWEVISVEVND
jgi:hypothetical protein